MKKCALIFMSGVLSLLLTPALAWAQQQPKVSTVTLYSVIKHAGENQKYCVNFRIALGSPIVAPCDLAYGMMYAGDDLDWFQSSLAEGNRSVIKDLGEKAWTAKFEVPVVESLAKLKPGEHRVVTVDTSGADGTPGKPGAPGQPGADADGIVRPRPTPVPLPVAPVSPSSSRAKHDGKPKIDPLFVKAITGHLYVIHVVDDARDFYALFRVEALERGDHCTVSWRPVTNPSNQARQNHAR
jgi:hypothetical protein